MKNYNIEITFFDYKSSLCSAQNFLKNYFACIYTYLNRIKNHSSLMKEDYEEMNLQRLKFDRSIINCFEKNNKIFNDFFKTKEFFYMKINN